ncbi:MAG TPA: acyl carrier protein [Candidatus Caccovivens faecavium]|nr:acyl carrier protein [Candidatus Caccovivens faecavium]
MIEKVKELLAEQLGIDAKTISDDANILEDLGADSLDIIEMLMTLEDEYGVTIPDDQINQVKTVKQVAELIEKCKK